jgi:hypothetical protein
VIGKAPFKRWKTMTFIAALRHDGIAAPCLFDGPISGAVFLAWMQETWSRRSSPAKSSSWTISAAIAAKLCAMLSARPERSFSSCRNIRRT